MPDWIQDGVPSGDRIAHLRQRPDPMRLPSMATLPATRFAPAAVDVTALSNGGMHLCSPQRLQSYPRRLGDLLCQWAATSPEQVFLAERAKAADGCPGWRAVTYAQTLTAVRRIGQALLNRELSVSRPVVILSDNSVDHALLGLAAMYVGLPVMPVCPAYSLASKRFAKLRHILDLAQPGLIFAADGEAFAPALQAVSPQAEIVFGAKPPVGMAATAFATLYDTPAGVAVDNAADGVGPDTIAKIMFSSGSTDLPKCVITTQRMMCSNRAAIAQVWPFLTERPPVLVDWLPWSHVFGGSFCFNIEIISAPRAGGWSAHLRAGSDIGQG